MKPYKNLFLKTILPPKSVALSLTINYTKFTNKKFYIRVYIYVCVGKSNVCKVICYRVLSE